MLSWNRMILRIIVNNVSFILLSLLLNHSKICRVLYKYVISSFSVCPPSWKLKTQDRRNGEHLWKARSQLETGRRWQRRRRRRRRRARENRRMSSMALFSRMVCIYETKLPKRNTITTHPRWRKATLLSSTWTSNGRRKTMRHFRGNLFYENNPPK